MSEAATPEPLTAPSRRQALAALGLGSVAMIVIGLQPLLLGELADAGRIDQALVTPAAIVEMLCLAAGVATCALWLRPRKLRLWTGGASLLSIALGLTALSVHGLAVVPLHGLAGLSGGVLIWVCVGMIARQARPEPWAAAFFLIQSAGQVFGVGLISGVLTPRFGLAGGPALAAGLSALGLALALLGPRQMADLTSADGGRRPSLQGLRALAALFLYFAANSALWFQMRPLATVSGLETLTGLVIIATLGAQMLGATAAVALAERISRRKLFAIVVGLGLISLAVLALHPPAPLFIAAYAIAAFAALLLGASLFGILGAADPSLRAGAISPAAQFCAAAFGPLTGLALAGLAGPEMILALSAVLMLAALACAWFSLPTGGPVSPDCA